jgi:DNA-binding NtrC family response regulator
MTAKANILIVDDEANTLASLSRAFRLAGHEAVVCDNAVRALELARTQPISSSAMWSCLAATVSRCLKT